MHVNRRSCRTTPLPNLLGEGLVDDALVDDFSADFVPITASARLRDLSCADFESDRLGKNDFYT